jgi:hypothetical protein
MIEHYADRIREVSPRGDAYPPPSREVQGKYRKLISFALPALACWFSFVLSAATNSQILQVTQLKAQSSESELGDARNAFQNRQAIVVMTEGTVEDFGRLIGAQLATTKAFSKTSSSPVSAASALNDGVPLTLRGVAAYIDANGVTRAVQTFAPANDPGNGKNGWKQHLNDWATTEQTKALAAVGDPGPPSQAWTLLYQTTVYSAGFNNSEQNSIAIYRLNDTNRTADFYMVYTSPQVSPLWGTPFGGCNGFDECDWHTISQHFEHDAPKAGIFLADHGPTGTVGNGTAQFQLGLSLSGSGPGGSVSWTSSWSSPDVVTVDNSNAFNALWDESFHMNGAGSPCNPIGGGVSPSSQGTFLSHQGSIFQVPEGTSSLTFPIIANAQFCYWTPFVPPGVGPQYETVVMQSSLTVGAPVLNATPKSLTIPAGGTALLSVNALIPGSDEGFPWTITPPSWISVPKNGYTQPAVIPVAVNPGTPNGTTGFIKIDSSPSFAAPSVENGAISIPVTVGNSGPNTTAGVLLFGGLNSNFIPQNPMFYYLGSKQFSPLNPPAALRSSHTATVLNNGKVLIAGGGVATAELFDPSTLSFSQTGTMANGRSRATATLLPDGKVLIVGGGGPNGLVGAAELYDPASGTFSPAGSLVTPRELHGATASSSGADPGVIVYGGRDANGHALDSWEFWSETTNSFRSGLTMAYPVYGFPNPVAGSSADAFHIVGGRNDDSVAIASEQLLRSDANFSVGDSLQTPRAASALVALGNGDLLVTGGSNSSAGLASAEIRTASGWGLVSGSTACPGAAGCMTTARVGHTANTLPDGTVFIAGGSNGQSALGTTEFFDPKTNTFTAGPTGQPRQGHTASLVSTTFTTLTNNPPTSSFGQSVELVATVNTGLGTAQGSVQFLDGTTVLQTLALQNGSATFTTSALAQGSHTLTAKFLGGGGSGPSTSPAVTQQIGKTAAATVTLSGAPNPAALGGTVTFTASVTAEQGTPSGTVTFNDGSTALGPPQTIVNGSAQLKTASLSAGQHSITAVYSGDANFNGATSTALTQSINSTTTQLSSTPNPSQQGQSVQLVATVTSANGSPTGSVNFLDGAVLLGSSSLTNGTAQFPTSSLTVGTHSLTAVYTGDAHFPGSSSALVSQTVSGTGGGKVTPAVDLTVNGSKSGATVSTGDKVTFDARIHAAPGYPPPTGSITISDSTTGNTYGSNSIGKDPNSNDGLVTITNSGIPAGAYSLVATYGGDNEGKYYNGAMSNTVSLTVNGGVGGPPPQPRLTISAVAGQRQGQSTQLPVSLTLTNAGSVTISGVSLNQITLRTVTGSGHAVLVSPSTPITTGAIQAGQSTVLNLLLDVPLTVRQLDLKEKGVLQDTAGDVFRVSTGQVIFP